MSASSAQFALSLSFHLMIFFVAVWDWYQLLQGEPSLTVSTMVRGWARENMALPIFVGFVLGHLFWH